MHRTLGNQLAKLTSENQKNWSDYSPYAVFAMNSSIHRVNGVSPYYCMFGVQCLFSFDSSFPVNPDEPYVLNTRGNLENIRQYVKNNVEEYQKY